MIQILTQSTHLKVVYQKATALEKQLSEDILQKQFRCKDSSVEHSHAFKKGFIDNIVNFYIFDKNLLPVGFLPHLEYYYQEQKLQYEIVDLRKFPGVNKEYIKKLLKGEILCGTKKPRDYQIEAVVNILKKKSGIIKCPPGSGKTFIAFLLTQIYANSKILFVFNRIDLITQTYERFIEYGLKDSEISIIQGKNFKDEGRIILLSVMSYDNALHLFPEVKVVILDECHSMGQTETSQRTIYSCQNAPVHIGLSATPDKLDNPSDQMRLYGNLGPIIFEREIIDQINEGVLENTEVHLHKYQSSQLKIIGSWQDIYDIEKIAEGEPTPKGWERFQKNGKSCIRKFKQHGDEYNHITNNDARNQTLADIMKEYSSKGKRVLGLFTNLKHGALLKEMLPDNTFLISGKDDQQTRKEAERYLKHNEGAIILASNIWSIGKDLPFIDVLVNCAGGVSSILIIQKAGRVFRKSPGKDLAIVIDLDDSHLSPIGKKQTKKRIQIYTDMKLPLFFK
jgi:superfamily II DNA or RNA helicase